jgi:hypothetical protein
MLECRQALLAFLRAYYDHSSVDRPRSKAGCPCTRRNEAIRVRLKQPNQSGYHWHHDRLTRDRLLNRHRERVTRPPPLKAAP